MNAKQVKLFRSSIWLALGAALLALLAGCVTTTNASAKPDDPPAQDKKQENKDDKEKKGLPLKPDRKIEFTTDEGTWLSLDVSPDGKTFVFEWPAKFYTFPSGGGAGRLFP